MKYGDVVQIKKSRLPPHARPRAQAGLGRWMVIGPVERVDPHAGPRVTAICLMAPSEAWDAGEISGIWINQTEVVA